MENRGRDVRPFLVLLDRGQLDRVSGARILPTCDI